MNLQIYRVILPVSNIEEAEKFYSQLFVMDGERVSPGRHYFNLGGVILACFDPAADGDDIVFSPNPDHIYISTSNLETIFNRATKLNCKRIDGSIETMPWGERCFYFTDPFDNQICIVDEKTKFTGM